MLIKALQLSAAFAAVGIIILLIMRAVDGRHIDAIWRALSPGVSAGVFAPELVAQLPEPARRYLLHAIAAGTSIATTADLSMAGQIRLKEGASWMKLSGIERISPPRGFVWKASAGGGAIRFSGADYYFSGRGRVKFRLYGLLPIAKAEGIDVDKSALGRLALETVLIPPALLPGNGVIWEAAGDDAATATTTIDGRRVTIHLELDSQGALVSCTVPRWGRRSETQEYEYLPFVCRVHREKSFGGYTIPAELSVGWIYGEKDEFEFFRVEVSGADYS